MAENEKGQGEEKRDEHFRLQKVENYYGSSAAAGSGDFHRYRKHRRTELGRLRELDEKEEQEELQKEFDRKREENDRIAREKTAKNAQKRKRNKERQKAKKAQKTTEEKTNGLQDSTGEANENEASDDKGNVDIAEISSIEETAREQNRFKNDGSFLEGFKALGEYAANSRKEGNQ